MLNPYELAKQSIDWNADKINFYLRKYPQQEGDIFELILKNFDRLVNNYSELNKLGMTFSNRRQELFCYALHSEKIEDFLLNDLKHLKKFSSISALKVSAIKDFLEIIPNEKEKIFSLITKKKNLIYVLVNTLGLKDLLSLFLYKRDEIFALIMKPENFKLAIRSEEDLKALVSIFPENSSYIETLILKNKKT